MPQKKPINKESVKIIEKQLRESYSAVLMSRSILKGYFKQTEKPIQDIETVVRLHNRLIADLREKTKKENSNALLFRT